MGERTTGEPPPYKRLTVAQAADQLGITEGAVRSRIKRGTIATDRVGGAVYVVVGGVKHDEPSEPSAYQPPNTDEPRPDVDQRLIESYQARIEDKDAHIESLERQLQNETEARLRADHLIAALTERIPELEAPPQSAQEAESVAESASKDVDNVDKEEAAEERTEPESTPSQSAERRPWWRRIFGR
jgi:hypothetical protein